VLVLPDQTIDHFAVQATVDAIGWLNKFCAKPTKETAMEIRDWLAQDRRNVLAFGAAWRRTKSKIVELADLLD
jgi:hypothetical protein